MPRPRTPAPRRRRRAPHPGVIVAAVVVVFIALLASYELSTKRGSSPPVTTTTTTPPVVVSVGTATCTFVDPSRTTKNYVTETSTPGRRLVTDVYFPAVPASSRRGAGVVPARKLGPFPAIFFAEGYGIDPSAYRALIDRWVLDRDVVIAPEFPDASAKAVAAIGGSDADEADMPNEPGDLAFVTRRSLIASATGRGCPPLRAMITPAEIGLAGQSDGATVAAMLGYDHGTVPGTTATYSSLRAGLDYRADAVLSGSAYGSDPYSGGPSSPALLSVESATDTCNTPTQAVDLYAAISQPARWFLAIRSAEHLTPYEGQDAPAFKVVAAVTGAFFNAELRGDAPGPALAAAAASSPSVATLVHGSALPAFLTNAVAAGTGNGGVNCYAT